MNKEGTMKTILIADDEKLIRAGIRKILNDNLETKVNFIEARNGQEALELCKNNTIDLIITDIRMPLMDGVQLMKELNTMPESERPSIIVISGFDDFTYAKAAISAGAVNYILKPIDKKELVDTVTSTLCRNKETKIREYLALDHILAPGSICISMMHPDIKNIFNVLTSNILYQVIKETKSYMCILAEEDTAAIINTILETSDIHAGFSSVSVQGQTVLSLQNQSDTALCNFFTYDSPSGMNIFQYSERYQIKDFAEIDSSYEKCVSQIDIYNIKSLLKELKAMFDLKNIRPEYRASALFYLYCKITNNLFSRYPGVTKGDSYLNAKQMMIIDMYSCRTLDEWIHLISDYMLYVMTLLKKSTGNYPYINRAIEYINDNYADSDLTMIAVANQVSVNYTWFSEKFKEQMGINFNEYLKKLRISKAQKLMASGSYKIYEVAEKTGYGTTKNFIKAFRDISGMNPSEWNKSRAN